MRIAVSALQERYLIPIWGFDDGKDGSDQVV